MPEHERRARRRIGRQNLRHGGGESIESATHVNNVKIEGRQNPTNASTENVLSRQ